MRMETFDAIQNLCKTHCSTNSCCLVGCWLVWSLFVRLWIQDGSWWPFFCVASCWRAVRIMLLHGMLSIQWGEGMVVRILPLRWWSSCLSYALTGFACESSDSLLFLLLFLFRRVFLLAYFSYHAIAWYVVHAVGRWHGGENCAAAVVEFLP
jgi:hypothetical protein